MAYVSVSLPAPAGNGAGAAVDVSSFGALKTITVTAGGDGVLEPTVIVEASNQASPTKWAPLATFAPNGEETVEVAVRWMRARVQNFRGGSAPVVEVGGEDEGTSFATLAAPSGNGTGAGVDVSSLPTFKSIHVAGPFQGTVNIEVSEDAGATYQTVLSFGSGQAGIQSSTFAAEYMRVSRNGVPLIDPGTPIVNIGACAGGGGGGGGGSGEPRFRILDVSFIGVTHEFNAVPFYINLIDPTLDDAVTGATAILPAASSVENGTWIWIKWAPSGANSIPWVIVQPDGSDTIDSQSGDYQVDYQEVPGTTGWIFIRLFSDGVSNWVVDGGFRANALPAITKTFRYVADGTEGSDFTVPIPAPWGIASYNATCNSGGCATGQTFECVLSDSTDTDVHVKSSASLTLADVLVFNLVAI